MSSSARRELFELRRTIATGSSATPTWDQPEAACATGEVAAPALDPATRILELEALVAQRSSDLDVAIAAAGREMPPIEVVRRVERCVEMARLDGGIGLGFDKDHAIVLELEALADHVLTIRAVSEYRVRQGTEVQGRYICVVQGKFEAQQGLNRMLQAAVSAFGVAPSDTEILARYWERRLDSSI